MRHEPPDRISHGELLRRTALGDQRAFARLHSSTVSRMRRVARSALGSPNELDDVLQEAYLKIWRRARQFDPTLASPITWMSAVVHNAAIDLARSNQVRDRALRRCIAEAIPMTAEPPDAEHLFARACTAMQVLSEERRSLIFRAYLQGRSRSALAEEFEAPPSTIKTWLRRSLLTVRDVIEKEAPL